MVFLAKEQPNVPTKDLISWYFDEPRCDPDRPIYIDAANPDRYYTHASAKKTIRQLCAGFRATGLQKGDCVCVHSFNDVNYPILANGIIAFGGIIAGTNPSYQPYELAHAIKVAEVKCMVVEPEILKHALKAADDSGIPRERIFVFNHREYGRIPDGLKSWRSLLEHGEQDWVRFDDLETSKNTTAGRYFTSGTTGLPKAAKISHHNLKAQHWVVNEYKPKPYEEKRLIPMPFFHIAVAPCIHFSPLNNGVPTYVMRRFELEPWLQHIEKYGITDLATVPPIVISVIMSDLRKKYSMKTVRFVTCGAAPLEKRPQARFQELLDPEAPFTQVWGMTETTCIATNFYYPEHDTTGSCGRPVPGIDMKLIDDEGRDITDYDVRGELCVRGLSVIQGYLDEKATAASWDKDGFFHTGDIAYCDRETEKWYIVDRKKELIKVRGFQVAPPELEAVLLSHEHIVDAGVIGVQPFEDDQSEYPRAYIVRRDSPEGKKLSAEDVKRYMAERLAKYKRIEGGVVFVDDIPKNPSGKILKKDLRERAKQELKQKRQTSKL